MKGITDTAGWLLIIAPLLVAEPGTWYLFENNESITETIPHALFHLHSCSMCYYCGRKLRPLS